VSIFNPLPERWKFPREFRPSALLGLFPTPSRAVVAVSGGADSVALSCLMADVLLREGHQLDLIHVHHGIRGDAADADAGFVLALADWLGVPSHIERIPPGSLPPSGMTQMPSEDALRRARQALLIRRAYQLGARAIAYGHHRDDLAETFLMMGMRGAGPAGLGSLLPIRALDTGHAAPLLAIRPLLSCARADLETFLRDHGVPWRQDETNNDTRIRRNAVRHAAIPLLEKLVPGAAVALAGSARLCAEATEALEFGADDIRLRCRVHHAQGVRVLDAERLRGNHRYMIGEAIRREWRSLAAQIEGADFPALLPKRDVVLRMRERVIMADGPEGRFSSPNGIAAVIDNRYVILRWAALSMEDTARALAPFFGIVLRARTADATPPPIADSKEMLGHLNVEAAPHSILNFENRILFAEFSGAEGIALLARVRGGKLPPGVDCELFDADAVDGSVVIASCNAEHEIVTGGTAPRAVAEIAREYSIPAMMFHIEVSPAMVADDAGPLWVPGIRRAARALITYSTKRVLACVRFGRAHV
jgi:tRNA(Ile)-lysidine synthetase-like protein